MFKRLLFAHWYKLPYPIIILLWLRSILYMSTLLRSEIDLNVFIDDLLALGKYWSSNFKKKNLGQLFAFTNCSCVCWPWQYSTLTYFMFLNLQWKKNGTIYTYKNCCSYVVYLDQLSVLCFWRYLTETFFP